MKDLAYKILVGAIFVALVCSRAAAIEITTGDGMNEGIVDNDGNFLYGTAETGCLVQIIKVAGGVPHAPNHDGSPGSGDTLIGTTEIGIGFVFVEALGRFDKDFAANYAEKLVCRAWNSVEVSSSSYYGNSEVHTVEGSIGEIWNINGSENVHAFATNIYFDVIPPDPPANIVATQDINGDLIVTWTKSGSPDAVGTRIVWRPDRYSTAEWDYLDSYYTDISTLSAQSYRITDLDNGVRYYIGGFSYDFSENYSAPASTYEVSRDTLPPSVLSTIPTGGATAVDTGTNIYVTFNDKMSTAETVAAFHMSPLNGSAVSGTGYLSPLNRLVFDPSISLVGNTTYICTVDATAKDDASNNLASPYTWSFRTQGIAYEYPPVISNFRIDGWVRFPGDVISSKPRLTANITDPILGYAGISTIEVIVNSVTYHFSSPEIYSVFSSGSFDFQLPVNLPEGIYTITLRAWNTTGYSSEESLSGLKVLGGRVKVIGPALNYPNPFQSGDGTTFAYTLNVDASVQIFIYSIKGSVVYHHSFRPGDAGGMAGYNEVFWDGLGNFGDGLGTGIYIVKLASGNRVIASFKIIIQNR